MAVSIATAASTPAEEEQFLVQVLRLRDAVLAGKHAQIRLPASAIEQIKARSVLPSKQNGSHNMNASVVTTAVDQHQQLLSKTTSESSRPISPSRLHTSSSSSGLDPIFLQKSANLVRAESVMKRQRIERELELQVEQRKRSTREKDHGQEGLFYDVNAILLGALERVEPISGLRPVLQPQMTAHSSFDENDYYSSHVHTDWSSDASSSKGSDRRAEVPETEALRRQQSSREAPPPLVAESSAAASLRAQHTTSRHYHTNAPEEVYRPDEDDEYTPPDATAFENPRKISNAMAAEQLITLDDDNDNDDDDDDYEPGEIMQSSAAQPSHIPALRVAAPVIRNNHLIHIAAPQPNRVSPLATAKGPSIELELVNGRPEVVHRAQNHHRAPRIPSRASTGSPVGNTGVMPKSARKKSKQKRKRQSDHENGREIASKKRRDKQADAHDPITPIHAEPYIKPEPLSPPPLQHLTGAPIYHQQPVQHLVSEIDLVSPQHLHPQAQYVGYAPRSSLRHEYAPRSPGVARLASPAGFQPVKRNNEDLRRVASLHHAQRPASPTQRTYAPITPYRAVTHTYGQHLQPTPTSAGADDEEATRYHGAHVHTPVQYAHTVLPRSPPRVAEYQDPYHSRAQTPVNMLPPPSQPRKIIVDQFGQRYYAAEPVPETPTVSLPPLERRVFPDQMYNLRASSRAAYAQPPQTMQYESTNSHTVPQPPPRQLLDQATEFGDLGGHPYREYIPRPAEPLRYAESLTSPDYRQVSRYEQMPPPQAPAPREQTSPVYAPTRAYSVRPDTLHQPQQRLMPSNYERQASIAPVQYLRQEIPPPPAARAMSVAASAEYAAPQNNYSFPSASIPEVKYVDQFGRPVYRPAVRQASEYRY